VTVEVIGASAGASDSELDEEFVDGGWTVAGTAVAVVLFAWEGPDGELGIRGVVGAGSGEGADEDELDEAFAAGAGEMTVEAFNASAGVSDSEVDDEFDDGRWEVDPCRSDGEHTSLKRSQDDKPEGLAV
jgi:hypothetical protein